MQIIWWEYISEFVESLQILIDIVHGYCNKWRLRANLCKSAVMVFYRKAVEGECKWESVYFLEYQLHLLTLAHACAAKGYCSRSVC